MVSDSKNFSGALYILVDGIHKSMRGNFNRFTFDNRREAAVKHDIGRVINSEKEQR